MAKKKVFIDVVIDDKGTTKRVAVDAKKLGKNLDETAISARTADRNIKGAANASSNATKNFSKMAQGTGGLVAAYATLAANIFAISAAYNFLKKAGDMRVMQEGQALYASKTGFSLQVLTNQLQGATQGLLKYSDAAQGAAIGTAAGLSGAQLTGLAEAASNVSKALGRDLTDSYNRLIRGATKAEPELLDELGIILRLDTAAAKYAATLGKTASELTAFERTQAVTNEILEQSNEKFKDFEGIDVSGIERLGKAFDDVVRKIMSIIEPLSHFIGNVMSDNVGALSAAFAGLGVGIVRSITPAMPSLQGVDTSTQGIAQRMEAFNPGGKTGKRISAAAQGKGDLTKRDVQRFEAAIGKKKSIVLDFERTSQREAMRTAELAKLAIAKQELATKTGLARMGAAWDIYWGTLIAEHGRTMGIMKGITMGFTSAVGKLMGLAGWVGVIMSAGVALKGLYDKIYVSEERLRKRRVIKTITDDIEKQSKALDDTRASIFESGNAFDQLAARMASAAQADFRKPLLAIGRIKIVTEEATKKMKTMATAQAQALKDMGKDATLWEKFLAILGSVPMGLPGPGGATPGFPAPIEQSTIDANEEFNSRVEHIKGFIPILQAMQAEEEANLALMKEGTPAYAAQAGHIEKISLALQTAEQDFKNNTDASKNLAKTIPELNRQIFMLGNTLSPAQENAKKLTTALQQATFGAKGFLDAMNKMSQFKTPFTGVLDNLTDVINGLNAAKDAAGNMDGVMEKDLRKSKIFDSLEKVFGKDMLKDVKSWDDLITKVGKVKEFYKTLSDIAMTELKTQKQKFALMKVGATPLLIKEIAEQEKLVQKRHQIRLVEIEILGIMKAKGELSEDEINVYGARIGHLQAELTLMESMSTEAAKLGMAMKSGFESNFQTNLAALLKTEESSIKDAMANIAKGMLGSIADQASETMTKALSKKLFGDPKDSQAAKNAKMIQNAHVNGIMEGFNRAKTAGGTTGVDGKGAKSLLTPLNDTDTTGGTTKINPDAKDILSTTGTDAKNPNANMIETPVKAKLPQAGGLAGVLGNFTERLTGLFDGDAPFLTKLGGLFTGLLGDFGGIFKSLFSGLSGIFGEGGSGFGGLLTSVAGIFGFANGGIVKGGFRKYANGGIAKSPHIGMIGEGKYNEAIVPLPDGRSIPVQGTGMGATNNTTVNVTVDSKGGAQTSTESDSQMGDQLGKLIAKAVQEELHYQQRSGGILNPYGAA